MKYFTVILTLLIECVALSQPLKERVILFPDRNLFISGEYIQFSALVKPEKDSAEVSRILYCELITPEGRRMSGGKYAATNYSVTGSLIVPPDLISGDYYLKAYTKSMRNEGPSVYSYDYIKVINPFRSEINAQKSAVNNTGASDFKAESEMSRSSVRVPEDAFPGENLKIMIEDSSVCRNLKNATISVVPEFTLSDRSITPVVKPVINDILHLPETKGILITGIVKNRSGNGFIPAIRVNLSITGEGRDFLSATTGDDGRFIFSVPDYIGKRDIFLCTESTDSLDPEIFVDNDFCNLPVELPEEHFDLSEAERDIGLSMAARLNLHTYFNDDSLSREGNKYEETPVFYGSPDKILTMDEYVQLPTLEEYFNELPVPVKVRKRSGQKFFKVLGTQAELLEFDPLVLVDLVVIDDPEKILALDPRDINRIDIVNALYVKGDRIFGGVVNIISRNGDFAGISLPSSGVFVNYSFLSTTGNNQEQPSVISEIPDTRNTILWKAVIKPTECSEISFTAPGTPGKYLVVIRGVDENGKEVRGVWPFEVIGQ